MTATARTLGFWRLIWGVEHLFYASQCERWLFKGDLGQWVALLGF
jgi:hypothetical protein